MRVEINRIAGDVYINGQKIIFGIDFNNPPTAEAQYSNLEWLIGWAKIGLISRGHVVPHFQPKELSAFVAEITPAVEAA
jgi:hypothetical protein